MVLCLRFNLVCVAFTQNKMHQLLQPLKICGVNHAAANFFLMDHLTASQKPQVMGQGAGRNGRGLLDSTNGHPTAPSADQGLQNLKPSLRTHSRKSLCRLLPIHVTQPLFNKISFVVLNSSVNNLFHRVVSNPISMQSFAARVRMPKLKHHSRKFPWDNW